MEWISINDRLPKMAQEVLVYQQWENEVKELSVFHRVEICTYINNGFYGKGDGALCIATKYWMPLPDPPKEQNK